MSQSLAPRDEAAVARPRSSFAAFPDSLAGDALAQWLEHVCIYPLQAVEWQCASTWQLGPRVLRDSMWFYFAAGAGWGRVGEEGAAEKFEIRSGDLMLIPQGAEHTIRQSGRRPMKLFTAHFHAHVFDGVNVLDLLGFPPHIPGVSVSPIPLAAESLAREWALKAPGWRAAMSAQILGVLLFIARHHGSRFKAPSGQAHADLPRLLPALERIDRNLPDPQLNIRDLARTLFVSEVQFRKLFRRVTGSSPARFIQRRRIEQACSLLHGSDLSIEEIAQACGFVESGFFCRVFKQWMKTTAGDYRRTVRV